MLLITQIKQDKVKVINGLSKKKFFEPEKEIDKVLELDELRKETQFKLDEILANANQKAKLIGSLIQGGKKEEAEAAKAQTASLKTQAKSLQETLQRHEKELKEKLLNIPNVAHESVPEGTSPEDNQLLFQTDNLPDLGPDALPHWELIRKYDIIDFDLGNKIAGAGFPVYKNKGAKLQRALINFFLDEAEKAGYIEIQPPVLVNQASGYGTGQLPDKEGQMYGLKDEDLYLIPTAEVPITNLYRDVILREQDLPIKNVGYSSCFRREAGSWGSHVRGLNRLHQFDKVEIVQVQKPENSYRAFDEMCDHVQGLLKKLELPYRMVRLCGGDLGFTNAITHDMEVFSAGQKKWLEVSSVSNFEAYQANRLKLRYKDSDNETQLLHTLNGSALALPRIVAALLENNQTDSGIKIPEVLQAYTRFDSIP